eukprot:103534-Pelagomonas_calceolata.AAC.6
MSLEGKSASKTAGDKAYGCPGRDGQEHRDVEDQESKEAALCTTGYPWLSGSSARFVSPPSSPRARTQLIKGLETARGNGTSMISLVMPPKDQVGEAA